MSAKFCCCALAVGALWFGSIDSIERAYDSWGLPEPWEASGAILAEARDAHERPIPSGNCVLYIVSDCTECSFKTFPIDVLKQQAKRANVLVIPSSGFRRLPNPWRQRHDRIFFVKTDGLELPTSWKVHAPFRAPARVTSQSQSVRIEVLP